MTAPIPDDLRRFIQLAVPSVPFLEALLLLRAHGDTGWDAPLLAQRLYLNDAAGARLLRALADAGIARLDASHPGHYHYAPQSPALRALLDRLAALYARNLVGVSMLIHAQRRTHGLD
jgi:hypothetical protein